MTSLFLARVEVEEIPDVPDPESRRHRGKPKDWPSESTSTSTSAASPEKTDRTCSALYVDLSYIEGWLYSNV